MAGKSVVLVLLEAFIVGIFVVLFGYIASFILSLVTPQPGLPKICKQWNKYYIMETTLFLTGFLLHLTFQYTGLNYDYASEYMTKYLNLPKQL